MTMAMKQQKIAHPVVEITLKFPDNALCWDSVKK